jgi:hypothetical protein
VWHVKIRRFEAGQAVAGSTESPKYVQIPGGTPTLYGCDRVNGADAVVICEGELDAVLLQQMAGDEIDAVAVGGKGHRPPASALARLTGARRWLVALDADADRDARRWIDYSARAQRVKPPEGNDVTEFYQAGGDLRGWIGQRSGAVPRNEGDAAPGC